MHSIATARLRSITQVSCRYDLCFRREQNGLAITIALNTSPLPGAPAVDDKGAFIGFINEFHILKVLENGRDLGQLTAEDMMVQDYVAIQESTTLKEAIKLMKYQHLLVLPVERNGMIVGCVSRLDLLQT